MSVHLIVGAGMVGSAATATFGRQPQPIDEALREAADLHRGIAQTPSEARPTTN